MPEPTDEQRRMARMLDCHPAMPETWPMELIDRLIWVQNNRPRTDFELEYNSVMRRAR